MSIALPARDWHWMLNTGTYEVLYAARMRIGAPLNYREKQLATICRCMLEADMPQTWVVT